MSNTLECLRPVTTSAVYAGDRVEHTPLKTVAVAPRYVAATGFEVFHVKRADVMINGHVIILNAQGEIFTGFSNLWSGEPSFAKAGEIETFNRQDALLTDPGYTTFVSKLNPLQRKAFAGAVFVRVQLNTDETINTETLLKAKPETIDYVINPRTGDETSNHFAFSGVFFNHMRDPQIGEPLQRFIMQAKKVLGLDKTAKAGREVVIHRS